MPQPTVWTEERIKKASAMWKEGASASDIAAAIGGGFSRSAVCGKLQRLGLLRSEHGKTGSRRKAAEGARSAKAEQPGAAKIAAVKKARVGGFAGKAIAVAAEKKRSANVPSAAASASLKPPMAVDGPVFSPAAREPVSLLALGADRCKWPLGDPLQPGFGFCGDQVQAGKPYCAQHHAAAYLPAPLKPIRRPADRTSVSTATLASIV